MRTLEAVANEYDQVAKVAATQAEDLPWQTRGAWAHKIEAAKLQVPALEAEYRTTLLRNAVVIFLDGDAVKQFNLAKLVEDSGEGVATSTRSLYDRLTQAVEVGMGRTREWGVGEVQRLHSALMEVMHEVKLSEIPMPSTRSVGKRLATSADVFAHVRQLVREACGDQLNALYMSVQVAKRAREIRYNENMVPVVVINALPDEVPVIGGVYAKGSATIAIKDDEEVNKDLMTKVFKEVSKKIRKK